ncbi:DUF6962 family protein [Maribellus maritimus]|uniref:DUF6962 family protein n=1 Tax=Maribellus maritimus TaxID=2870838 RepID=UPI001EE9CDA1|nr:hypothetical protein [Maribellus maritimus]MCG6187806.1 hypothetical protein [Maribellus maritimus]
MDEINSIVLGGIRIDEPIVTITDLLVSVLCFIYAYKIHKSGKKEKTFLYFKIYFFVMGIATMLGGLIGHAFLYAFNFYWKLPGWITSMISIMFVERAAIEHTRIWLKDSLVKIFGIINIIEFLTFLTLTVVTLNFFYVEFHSGYGLMFVVLSLEGFLFLKTKNIATKYLLTGVAFAALAAIFFMNKISPHQWFNYLSVSHVLMAVAATFFYQGAKRIDMSSAKIS